MNNTSVIEFGDSSRLLKKMLHSYIDEIDFLKVDSNTDFKLFFKNFHYNKIIFAFDLNVIGINYYALEFLEYCKINNIDFSGFYGGVLVKSLGELSTKNFSKKFIFEMNELGMSFIGHSLVEATSTLNNFKTWQKTINKSKEEICIDMSARLIERIKTLEVKNFNKKNILVLHASSNATSNTLSYWNMIKKSMKEILEKDEINYNIKELHVENGTVTDCKGCEFTTCMHFSKEKSCFYGGPIVKEILPAVEDADIIVWITPNYNDSISAMLVAVINRLTVLYRRISFHEKAIFNVVVSGNSGSDTVAMQVVNSLNINKGFFLPGKFSFKETANDPGQIYEIKNIEKISYENAKNICNYIQNN
ncbi:NAD(P)H-dependent oxidoreductase [Helicovermis profundi]|uniref:NAD(P)H-dependent oxidoreductase n=1 Tax=Helicovermis profundi TaxID=3065157 RepID=A0AAU9ENQ8_9FIRM|nr:NAD(P)H-dependent oxidoreductase [Clostridia bacterium S502]